MSLLAGRVITNIGDSLYFIAAMWLVFELTGSALYTGIAGFLVRGPAALQFLLGPLVDDWSLRRILVGTQLIQGVVILAIPIVAFTGHLSVWAVLAVMPILSLLNQFVYPAQSAALPQLVEDEQLVQANSLFAMARNGMDMLFNAVSGVLIAILGAVIIFLIDAVTFFIAAFLFAGVVLTSDIEGKMGEADEEPEQSYMEKLMEGINYVRGSVLVAIVYGALLANFVFGAGIAVFPAFADQIGGSVAYGLLMSVAGAGVFAGAMLSNLVDQYPYGWFQIYSKVFAGACIAAAVYVLWLPATLALVFIGFIAIGMDGPMTESMIQSSVPESLLGRVSSLMGSVSTAMIPVGALLGGVLSEFIGVNGVMYLVAASAAFYGVYFLLYPPLRALPPVAQMDASTLRL
ncbi:MFS transporter [Natronobiforma cellulositropha]